MQIKTGTRILLLQETNILLPIEEGLRAKEVKVVPSLLGVSDGVKRIHERTVDIALVDLYISGGGGMYLLSLLRHIRPDFPVVIFYPAADRLYAEIALDLENLGAVDVIQSPYDVEDTIARVAAAVARIKPD